MRQVAPIEGLPSASSKMPSRSLVAAGALANSSGIYANLVKAR